MHLPFDINATYIIGAFLLSIPGYLTWWSSRAEARRARVLAEANATKLEVVHNLVNSQSEKLNIAIQDKAHAEGELKGRANQVSEDQAAIAMAAPKQIEAIVTNTAETAAATATIAAEAVKEKK